MRNLLEDLFVKGGLILKSKRHRAIIKLIENNNINTQEEILNSLKTLGFEVTQATVSRDIKELRLLKVLSDNGVYKYTRGQVNSDIDRTKKFYSLLKDAILSIDIAINIIVIKSYPGMAQAICSSLDSIGFDEVLGTIAGDDTIFLLFKDQQIAVGFLDKLNDMIYN